MFVPDGVLFDSSNAHKERCRTLVEDHVLEGVVSLPSGVFRPYAGVSTAILLFTKSGRGGTDHVWFYDMTTDGWSLDDNRKPLLPLYKPGPAPNVALAEGEHGKSNLPDCLARWRQRKDSERERERTRPELLRAQSRNRRAGLRPQPQPIQGEQGAAALLLASHQRMGSCAILAEVAGFFSKLLKEPGRTRRSPLSGLRARVKMLQTQPSHALHPPPFGPSTKKAWGWGAHTPPRGPRGLSFRQHCHDHDQRTLVLLQSRHHCHSADIDPIGAVFVAMGELHLAALVSDAPAEAVFLLDGRPEGQNPLLRPFCALPIPRYCSGSGRLQHRFRAQRGTGA